MKHLFSPLLICLSIAQVAEAQVEARITTNGHLTASPGQSGGEMILNPPYTPADAPTLKWDKTWLKDYGGRVVVSPTGILDVSSNASGAYSEYDHITFGGRIETAVGKVSGGAAGNALMVATVYFSIPNGISMDYECFSNLTGFTQNSASMVQLARLDGSQNPEIFRMGGYLGMPMEPENFVFNGKGSLQQGSYHITAVCVVGKERGGLTGYGKSSAAFSFVLRNGPKSNPTVETLPAEYFYNVGTRLNGRVDTKGRALRTLFKYWPSDEPEPALNRGAEIEAPSPGEGIAQISVERFGLTPNRRYSYRLIAHNEEASFLGGIQEFDAPGFSSSIMSESNHVIVGFKTNPRQQYQILSTNSLESPIWEDVGESIYGDGSERKTSLPLSGSHKFFKVRVVTDN